MLEAELQEKIVHITVSVGIRLRHLVQSIFLINLIGNDDLKSSEWNSFYGYIKIKLVSADYRVQKSTIIY